MEIAARPPLQNYAYGSMSDPSSSPSGAHSGPARGITPATRQRLEAVLARAKPCIERGDHDYAHDLLTQCVAEDPGSLSYLQAFRSNLAKKYAGTGKKSSMFGTFVSKSGRASVAKPVAKGDWQAAFTAGCQALKKNPVDLPVLRELAHACGALGHRETQLFYLRWALELDPQDVDTNRAAGDALGAALHFDQAIACWQRVLKQKPQDEEARRAVSRLSVEQTLHQGGYDHQQLKGEGGSPDLPAVRVADLAVKRQAEQHAADQDAEAPELTEKQLLAAVEEDASDVASALKMSDILVGKDRPEDAEKVLRRAMKHTPADDAELLNRVEDARLRVAGLMVEAAQEKARQKRSEEVIKHAKEQVVHANQAELEVYEARTARTPGDPRLQYELGLRLKRAGRHRDAIKSFQVARSDKRRGAEAQLQLGECFQHIQQYKLAAGSYEEAIKAIGDDAEETRKLALYRAGVLAILVGDLDLAETRLTELAAMDFGYKDVGDRLDKIAELRKNA